MPPTWPWKHSGFNSRSPLAWLLIVVLICANVATLVTLWSLMSGQGKASEPHLSAPAALLLPEPVLTPVPTSTATRVMVYAPTSTVTGTPTQLPAQLPTATNVPLPPPTATPLPVEVPTQNKINHVVIISIDGLRPDALDLTDTPTLDRLRAMGAYVPNAQTVKISETLPSHASMLSGMVPEKHGVLWGLPYIGWPGITGPTLFSVAHEAGLNTAMVFGKQKLNHVVLPNSVDRLFGADTGDTEVKVQAVDFIEAGLPNVLFIHFPDTDRVGHSFGWLSPNQLQSITFVDGMIGEVVTALERGGYLNSTLLIITADHGGHGQGHGDDSPEDRTIPWLAVGPGVPPGVILTGSINTFDTAATALSALDLPVPERWDGRSVLDFSAE